MPACQQGVLLFVKNGVRHFAPVSIHSLAESILLAQELEEFTTAQISHAYYIEFDVTGMIQEGSGQYNTAEVYARVEFKDVDSDNREKILLKIPAPALTKFEHKEHIGYCMTSEAGQELAQKYGDVIGKTLRFVKGRIYGGGYSTR